MIFFIDLILFVVAIGWLLLHIIPFIMPEVGIGVVAAHVIATPFAGGANLVIHWGTILLAGRQIWLFASYFI